MMRTAILNFPSQFSYQPKIENVKNFKKKKCYIVVGMGGSHLAADLIAAYKPDFPLITRRDYGLPELSGKELKQSLVVASSYSGNTEEVIVAYQSAQKKKLPLAVIAVGGKLIELAQKDGVPYVELPNTGIQPRSALGFSLRGLMKILGMQKELRQTTQLAKILDVKKTETIGRDLAIKMKDHVPVIYASRANETIAWNWKIKLNETGKIPAFYNVIPEMNHNEMNGFDVTPSSKHLSSLFHFIFLKDATDDKRNRKRMEVVEKLYRARGLPVTGLELTGKNYFEKIFTSLLIADWTALYTAELYGLEPEKVPMIEEFKRLIAE